MEQQIIVDLLHQLSFGTHRVKRLQQRGAQQPLRCNRLSAGAFVKRLELVIERGQHFIHDSPDRAQRVRNRYPRLHVDIGEQ